MTSKEKTSRKFNVPAARQILGLVKPHRKAFACALVALAVGSGINLAFPQIIRFALNTDALPQILTHPFWACGALAALFAIQGLSFYYRALLFAVIGQRAVADLRTRLFNSLLARSVEFFDLNRSGDLVSRLTADTAQIQDAVSIKLSVLIRYGLQVLVGIGLMLFLSPKMTAALVLGLPLLVGISMVLGKRLKAVSKAQQKALGTITTVAEEVFSGNRIVKAFSRERSEAERFRNHNQEALSLGIRRSEIASFFASFVNFLMNVFLVLVVFYGLMLVQSSSLSVGDLTAFLMYAAIVAVSFAFLIGAYTEFVQAVGGSERVFDLLQGHVLIGDKSDASLLPAAPSAPSSSPVRVEFESVSFAYPSRAETPVLKEVSFTLEPGSFTALVGPSGAGKSSIVHLLLGFYFPQKGVIRVDGTPLSEESVQTARAKMSFVPQDAQLFGVSLADNLRFGNPLATNSELEKLCDEVALGELIRGLPEGLATLPGDRAVQLSGGQKQRFALARALTRDPGLLILDEATSSLDGETEQVIQNFLATRVKGKTMLVVAHRLATVQHSDQILVLDRGVIVQRGRHEELSRVPGLYRSLVERQELSAA